MKYIISGFSSWLLLEFNVENGDAFRFKIRLLTMASQSDFTKWLYRVTLQSGFTKWLYKVALLSDFTE